MAPLEPLEFSQPANELTSIADAERKKLTAKNDYFTNNLYNSRNKNALADGDLKGKGTGGFLDIFNQNAGSSLDIKERKAQTVVNEYQPNKPYTTPTA